MTRIMRIGTIVATLLIVALAGATEVQASPLIGLRWSFDGGSTWLGPAPSGGGLVFGGGANATWSLAETGQGSPLLAPGTIDLASTINATATGTASKLIVEVSQTDQTPAFSSYVLRGALTLDPGLSASLNGYIDSTNHLFGVGGTPEALLAGDGLEWVASSALSAVGTTANTTTPYSLTMRLTVDLAAGQVGFRHLGGDLVIEPAPVPEPMSLWTLGIGFASIGLVLVHRRRNRAAENL